MLKKHKMLHSESKRK